MNIKNIVKKQILTVVLSMLSPLTAIQAQQNYPARPVRLVIAVPPGGAADLVGRVIAQKLGDALGQTFVADNRGGGGGMIAADIVAKSAPDGYTLLLGSITTHGIGPHVYSRQPYDPVKDFSPVVLAATMPMIVVVNAAVPAKSVKELIALAKARPGTLGFASSGSGGAPHLVGELFKSATGAPLQHIPYKGSGPAATDVAAGQVAVSFDAIAPHLAHIKSSRTRVLAAISPQRLAMFPEVPTMTEIGFPQVAASIWYGLLVQSATPKTIISKLNAETNRVLIMQDVKDRLGGAGIDAAVPNSPDDFAKFIRDELAKWGPVVKASGAKAD